ncbi:zona pellucida-binding protein 2-like [Mobula birostris]|uniref:zona pellucida-binding protein 2-like n=1 Tax=Mobula birostris TaxID=1983395 RepID=UPI003B286600
MITQIYGNSNKPVKVYVKMYTDSPSLLCTTEELSEKELVDPYFIWIGPTGRNIKGEPYTRISETGRLILKSFEKSMSGDYTCTVSYKDVDENKEVFLDMKFSVYGFREPDYSFKFSTRYHTYECHDPANHHFFRKFRSVEKELITDLTCRITDVEMKCHVVKVPHKGLVTELFITFKRRYGSIAVSTTLFQLGASEPPWRLTAADLWPPFGATTDPQPPWRLTAVDLQPPWRLTTVDLRPPWRLTAADLRPPWRLTAADLRPPWRLTAADLWPPFRATADPRSPRNQPPPTCSLCVDPFGYGWEEVCKKFIHDCEDETNKRVEKARRRIKAFFKKQSIALNHMKNKPTFYYIENSLKTTRVDHCRPGFGKNKLIHLDCSECCVVCDHGMYSPTNDVYCKPCSSVKINYYGATAC